MLALCWLSGCGPSFGPNARNGIVFYCPGIGNFDGGHDRIREGLEQAGFKGEVATFYWTLAPGPLAPIDQVVRINPRLRAGILARHIEEYIDKFPGRPVNLVGLSAGTGVAMWALEDLKPGYRVDNVVLLSSSLSSGFDARKALRNVAGKVYVYYSPNDAVLLVPMRVSGTIDGVYTEDAAGVVGLRARGHGGKIVNIAWRPEFESLGYYGGHLDSTSPRFVQQEIAPRILNSTDVTAVVESRLATGLERPARGANPD